MNTEHTDIVSNIAGPARRDARAYQASRYDRTHPCLSNLPCRLQASSPLRLTFHPPPHPRCQSPYSGCLGSHLTTPRRMSRMKSVIARRFLCLYRLCHSPVVPGVIRGDAEARFTTSRVHQTADCVREHVAPRSRCRQRKDRVELGRRIRRPTAAPTSAATATGNACHTTPTAPRRR